MRWDNKVTHGVSQSFPAKKRLLAFLCFVAVGYGESTCARRRWHALSFLMPFKYAQNGEVVVKVTFHSPLYAQSVNLTHSIYGQSRYTFC